MAIFRPISFSGDAGARDSGIVLVSGPQGYESEVLYIRVSVNAQINHEIVPTGPCRWFRFDPPWSLVHLSEKAPPEASRIQGITVPGPENGAFCRAFCELGEHQQNSPRYYHPWITLLRICWRVGSQSR